MSPFSYRFSSLKEGSEWDRSRREDWTEPHHSLQLSALASECSYAQRLKYFISRATDEAKGNTGRLALSPVLFPLVKRKRYQPPILPPLAQSSSIAWFLSIYCFIDVTEPNPMSTVNAQLPYQLAPTNKEKPRLCNPSRHRYPRVQLLILYN